MNGRWRRWILSAAGVAGLYGLAGGWLLPELIARGLPGLVESELGRKLTVGAVSFNPYTLRLEARDVRLAEADGAPLFSLGALAVELRWRSLARRAWRFADIRLTAPAVQLAIAPDGRFNIARLLETLARRRHDDDGARMPRLVIDHLTLEGGRVEMDDRHAGYRDSYAPIDFTLHHLSTLPDENGDLALSADASLGGKLRWKGAASLNPMAGSGELTLENVSLPGLSAYLRSYLNARVSGGRLSARLPYHFSYGDGRLRAGVSGAGLALADFALQRADAADAAAPFVSLKRLDVGGVDVDLAARSVRVAALTVNGGALAVRRDARGELDVANLAVASPASPASSPDIAAAVSASRTQAAPRRPWQARFERIALDDIAVSAIDETVSPALRLGAGRLALRMTLRMETAAAGLGTGLGLDIGDAALSLADVALASGTLTPLTLSRLGLEGGTLDLAARRAGAGRLYAEGGQLDLSRDGDGRFLFLSRLPRAGVGASISTGTGAGTAGRSAAPASATATATAAPWQAAIGSVELSSFGALYDDPGTGIKANLQDFKLKLDGASTDLKRPLRFEGGVGLREGGTLAASGTVTPATGAVDARLDLRKLALAPVRPLLARHLKLRIADGAVNAAGRLRAGMASGPALRYDGSLEVAELALDEEDNDHFIHWKSVRADQLALTLSPDMLDVAELRVVEPNAILIIENDRSFNAGRLLVHPPADGAAQAAATPDIAAPAATTPFPVRVRRVRVENGKLDFTDLSLRPQFAARIFELNGVVTGLSTRHDARSQIELDGRVDEFGQARVRGQLNPFVPAGDTDLNMLFKNIDMVSASPYSMKFAGYRIAEGKISLDLRYRLRDRQLDGDNQIRLDKLTLGERIDSPDALKLPLELALAILKDSDGRIELGLPVAGSMGDPRFSYGGALWKAAGNVVGKVIGSPFRALGNMLGVAGDGLEAIEFDPGSGAVPPPEREKLRQVARILAAKPGLALSVPGQYSVAADGAALRMLALRRAVAARADIAVAADEAPGPLDIGQRKVRAALRGLYAERFGAARLEREKTAAESAEAAGAAKATDTTDAQAAAPKKLAMLERMSKLVQGEPRLADAGPFYDSLRAELEQNQPLPADALAKLGAARAAAILAVLTEAQVDAGALRGTAPEAVDSGAGQPVALKLGLATR